jgi:hypothetical protein
MSYPEALFVCGATHNGADACMESLFVKLSLTDNAIYMCNRGHRLGDVSDVDQYLMALVLGALSRPAVRQRLCVSADGGSSVESVEPMRAFAQWWDDASPSQRYEVMVTAIDRVVVAPQSMFELDVLPVVVVHWKGSCS